MPPRRAMPTPLQVIADFVRNPTTYVVVGVEDVPCGTTTDASKKTSETHDEAPGRQSPVAGARNEIESSRRSRSCSSCSSQNSPGGGGLGAAVRHPMKWQMGESLLKPAPRIWVGLWCLVVVFAFHGRWHSFWPPGGCLFWADTKLEQHGFAYVDTKRCPNSYCWPTRIHTCFL